MGDIIQTRKLLEVSVIVWSFACLYAKFVVFNMFIIGKKNNM